MQQWWQQLNNREQRLIASLAAVVVVFLAYSLIWQPLSQGVIDAEKKLARQQALLTYVVEETARYNALKGSQKTVSSGSLSSIVNRSAQQKNITIARMQPQNQELQVWIDNIAFNQLLAWLEQLANQQGVQVKAIDLSQGDQPGQVRVKRLQLGR